MRIPVSFLLAGVLVLAALPSRGDRDLGPESGVVTVNAHEEEMERLLGRAGRAEARGDWEAATGIYEQAVSKAHGQVRRVGRRTYLGIREYVKLRIRSWPPAGLRAYRSIVDPKAGALYERGLTRGDTSALDRIARRTPLSSYGARALLALGTLELSRGDPDGALRRFREILRIWDGKPIPGVARAEVLARAGLAAAKRGDPMLLEELRARAKRLPGETTVRVTGRPEKLTAFLASLEAAPPGSAAPPGWTTPGGCASRSGGREGPDGPLELYFAWEIPGSDEQEEEPPRGASPAPPIHPLIADQLLIVVGQATIHALALPSLPAHPTRKGIDAIRPVEVWSFPPFAKSLGGPPNSGRGQPPVFATAGEGLLVFPFRDVGGPLRSTASFDDFSKETLVALSLGAEGKMLDQRGGIETNPEWRDLFRDVFFCGAPVIRGRRVYVSAVRMNDHQPETLVFGFDLVPPGTTMRPRWRTTVCVGIGESARLGVEPSEQPARASSIALGDGLVYVCSNTGAVAALEAETGEIIWIHTYEQAERPEELYPREVPAGRPWATNPPMLDHRFLYVTPRDADHLLIYYRLPDPKTGYVLHDRIGRDEMPYGFDPRYLLGVRRGVAFLAGPSRAPEEPPLFALKAGPAFTASGGRPGDPLRILWRAEIEESAPAGRGVLAGGALYFPTRKGIYRVDAESGAVRRLVDPASPRIRKLTHGLTVPGNLAVSGPWLVSASDRLICLFGPAPERKDGRKSGD